MEKFIFKYSNDYIDLCESISRSLNCEIINNSINLNNNDNFKGKYYFSKVDEDTSCLLIDVIYQKDTFFEIRNNNSEFIALCYNISSSNFELFIDEQIFQVGSDQNNLTTLDSSLDCDVIIKKDCKAFNFYIFISKKLLKDYVLKKSGNLKRLEELIETSKNTIVRFERMNYLSSFVLAELEQHIKKDMFWSLFMKGAVYELLDIYIENLLISETIVAKVTAIELNNILISQQHLKNALEDDFPGIENLSQKAAMSPTKYKNIFKKIIGTSPKSYFLMQKLEKGKEMLIAGNSVNEVSIALGYKSTSHFVSQFRGYYGITPKDYILKY
ncbi:helix-turn-helix domain-containing protein [Chryseobacterium sp. G0201]|uniref:helix-turn-helix domain-containing protein n=1 Tax=Chryseobacterium sp. G0201 TaxID=2487065 RepID=UPI0013DE2A12|nr:helix-turn-helix domain-containing protein [Chryseobacterium sp. G0201]